MKSITEQATNRRNVTGKLLDAVFRDGKLGDGRPYESATVTIRVKQTYGGKEEISEIPVSLFAARYTKQNKPNPGFEQIQKLKELKTVQNVGFDEAATVRIANGTIRENNFVTRSGAQISGWQINTGFINEGKGADVASFSIDIFIMDMHPEEDREGDPTGRLIIKGGVVQYEGGLDVLEFIVEDPQAVDYMERHWNNNDTVNIRGRIRVTSQEQKSSGKSSSWGEDVPDVPSSSSGPSGRPIIPSPPPAWQGAPPIPGRERSAWPTMASCSWTSCRNSAARPWRCCGSPWRPGRSPSPVLPGRKPSPAASCWSVP